MEQKMKINHIEDSFVVFFFDHSFKSAQQHAEEYFNKNMNKYKMKMYFESSKSKSFPKWEFIKSNI